MEKTCKLEASPCKALPLEEEEEEVVVEVVVVHHIL